MAIGMSYDEYWYGHPELVIFYKQAYDCRRKEENQKLWLNGIYMQKAIRSAFDPKKDKYPEKPLDIYPKTEAEKVAEVKENRQKVIEYLNMFKQGWDNHNGDNR